MFYCLSCNSHAVDLMEKHSCLTNIFSLTNAFSVNMQSVQINFRENVTQNKKNMLSIQNGQLTGQPY